MDQFVAYDQDNILIEQDYYIYIIQDVYNY